MDIISATVHAARSVWLSVYRVPVRGRWQSENTSNCFSHRFGINSGVAERQWILIGRNSARALRTNSERQVQSASGQRQFESLCGLVPFQRQQQKSQPRSRMMLSAKGYVTLSVSPPALQAGCGWPAAVLKRLVRLSADNPAAGIMRAEERVGRECE